MNYRKGIFQLFILLVLLQSCSTASESPVEENEDLPNEPITEEPTTGETDSSPNIVMIIADDMGLDASPGYIIGDTKPNMPNLQNMIDTGILFNNVWANPTCTPTRATILTGKYGFRTGITKVDDPISTAETSLQNYLDTNSSVNYAHAVIGKWHLSRQESNPNDMGVGYYAGMLGGGVSSYTNWDLTINGSTETSTEYATTKLTDLAIDWVSDQTRPWFLWLAYNAPHTPFHLPPSNLHSQGDLPADQASVDADPTPYYVAMLEAMDTEFGRFLDTMDEAAKNNTVFIFIGDNGTPRQVVQGYDRLKAKGSIYEGGIRVPMVISGKNVTRMGEIEDALINATDLFSTISDIAGVGVTEINDSKSFKNLLTEEDASQRDYVYAEIGNSSGGSDYAIRNASHKYIVFANETEEMYNLVEDPFEQSNLLGVNGMPSIETDTEINDELKVALSAIREGF